MVLDLIKADVCVNSSPLLPTRFTVACLCKKLAKAATTKDEERKGTNTSIPCSFTLWKLFIHHLQTYTHTLLPLLRNSLLEQSKSFTIYNGMNLYRVCASWKAKMLIPAHIHNSVLSLSLFWAVPKSKIKRNILLGDSFYSNLRCMCAVCVCLSFC